MREQNECEIVKVPKLISENGVNSFYKNSEDEGNSLGKGSEKFDHILRGTKVENYELLAQLIR